MKSVLLMAGLAASASTTLFTAELTLSLPISIDYIKNGQFENNHLGNQDWFITEELLDWQIPDDVEIGKGSIYNSNWGNRIVVELDGNHNDVIRQKMNLLGLRYTLQIEYAARSGYVETSEMSVRWNAKQVAYVKGKDNNIHPQGLGASGLRMQHFGDIGRR
jgi:opacity protein-like surface antigen